MRRIRELPRTGWGGGHDPAWIHGWVLSKQLMQKGDRKSSSLTSSDLMPVRAQCVGARALRPTGATAAGGEDVWSECQLLMGSLLRGFTTCKKMLPSSCFPLPIREMFMVAVCSLLQL